MDRLSDTFSIYEQDTLIDEVFYENNSYEDENEVFLDDESDIQKPRPKLPSLSKKKNPTIQELEIIYDTKGYKSKEFCIYVRSFIFFVIRRYHGEPTEDLLNNCYLRLFELLFNFDKTKGNLASFIFSICRNEITKYQYRLKKIETELSVDVSIELDRCPYSSEMVEFDFDSNILKEQLFTQFNKISFSPEFIQDYSKDIIKCDLLTKVLLWNKTSSM